MDNKYLILITFDGCKAEILYDLIQKKEMPAFTEITDGGIFAENVVTIFPSDTMPAQVSIVTGCYPAKHKIYKNMWFDRTLQNPTLRAYTDDVWDASRVYGYDPYGKFPNLIMPKWDGGFLLNNDLNQEVKSIYEVLNQKGLKSAVFAHQFSKGADFYYPPSRKTSIKFVLQDKVLKTGKYGFLTEEVSKNATSHIKTNGLQSFSFIYFGETDAQCHKHGYIGLKRFLKNKIDPEFKKITKLLKSKKLLDKIDFIITADHSQAINKLGNWKIINKTKLKKLFGEFEDKIKITINKFEEEADLIITMGVSTFIYVKNGKTKQWKDEPDLECDILPIAKQLFLSNKNSSDGKYIDLIIIWNPLLKTHCVYDENQDIIPVEEYFKDKCNIYPLASERLAGKGDFVNGDIILLSNYQDGFVLVEKLEKGEHGNLSILDSTVPLIFSGNGITNFVKPSIGKAKYLRIIDIAPTIASYFGCSMPTAEGKSLIG